MAKVKIVGVPGKKRVRISAIPKRQAGGKLPVTKGLPEGMHHMANIEAEEGEVYQNQTGGFTKIANNAGSHEQGGVMIPDAQRVLEDTSTSRKDKHSKRLKISPDEAEQIFGFKPTRALSHAQMFEEAKKEYGKQTDKFNRHLKFTNKEGDIDKYSANSTKLNFYNKDSVPTDTDVFNTLFEHQEAIKAVHDIPDDGTTKKYGGFKYKKAAYGIDNTDEDYDITKGPKSKTAKGRITTTGKDVDSGGDLTLDEFKDQWLQKGLDLSKYDTTKDAQRAVYNYLAKKDPEQIRQMWKENGLTNLGRDNADKIRKLGITLSKNPNDPYGRLDVKDWDKLTPKQLAGLNDLAYADNNFKIRTLLPELPGKQQLPGIGQSNRPDANVSADGNFSTPQGVTTKGDDTSNPGVNFKRNQGSNDFYEGTNWYDLAPGLAELISSETRDPELYNPVQIHQLKYKLLNPTSAVQQNQADYNAALKSLGNNNLGSGVAAANVANLTAQKYKANNQIEGQYENENAQIQNREIDYNTQARDRQSMADAGSRATFYSNVLKGRDNQRLQKLQAIQDLSRVMQLKARQNTSGNLIEKLSPHFDQTGNYNGKQYVVTLPDGTQQTVPAAQRKYKVTQTRTSKEPTGDTLRETTTTQ